MVLPMSDSNIGNYLDNYQSVYNNYAKIIDSNDDRIHTVLLSD